MSAAARNSLIAWGSVLAFLGLGWLVLYFDLMPEPPSWLPLAMLAVFAIGLLMDLARFLRRARRDA